ncbi:twinfilin TWF1 [Sporobolomyces salmoneus]|uniref:twinfilin TWF1 n=1 Tax=Sporobolomyces salmoneus TaxID=183962 RepID=UPI003177F65B
MAAQSGIVPTAELSQQWSSFLNNAQERVFKISIQEEQLQPDGNWSIEDEAELEKVFKLFGREDVAQDKSPSYFIVKVSPTSSSGSPSLLFISYVPDNSPVRSKMLYASTRTTIIRHLGDSQFSDSIFATSKDDLSYNSYLAHTRHSSAAAPLTARETEMRDIRAAESAAADDSNDSSHQQQAGRSIIFGQRQQEGGEGGAEVKGALPWSDEAKEAVRGLNDGKEVVQLEIDLKTENIVLSEPQPSSLALPADKPCYFFYRHAAGIVLIYSCPPKSPIKSRLIYSSAVLVFYKYAAKEFAGVEVLKKLETDDPSEVTKEWIDSELGPLATNSTSTNDGDDSSGSGTLAGAAPMPKEDRASFARPTRPGRSSRR